MMIIVLTYCIWLNILLAPMGSWPASNLICGLQTLPLQVGIKLESLDNSTIYKQW